MGELLKITEAAERLHVARQTIYAWINAGKIQPIRTPGGRLRIPEEQLTMPVSPRMDTAGVDVFPVVDISLVEPDFIEQMGSKEKFWYYQNGDRYLFKAGRPNTGENWAEKVAGELCELLGISHARYDLARWGEVRGVITPSFVPEGSRLVHGNELLAEIEPGYAKTKTYKQTRHTLSRVLQIIGATDLEPPLDWSAFDQIHSAVDVFLGYLMLDAWIANQDRHHENWAIVVTKDKKKHLAPSYDHAASLGRNERDQKRQVWLNTKDPAQNMQGYVERARSAFYSSVADARPVSTLAAFREAGKQSPGAAKSWLNRLAKVSSRDTLKVFKRLSGDEITVVAIDFGQRILELNRERILSLRF